MFTKEVHCSNFGELKSLPDEIRFTIFTMGVVITHLNIQAITFLSVVRHNKGITIVALIGFFTRSLEYRSCFCLSPANKDICTAN